MKSAKDVAVLLFITVMSLGMAACSDNDDSPASPDMAFHTGRHLRTAGLRQGDGLEPLGLPE